MKKIILTLISLLILSTGFAQVTVTPPVPVYGCPFTTHDVSIGAKNNTGFPLTSPYSIAVTLYDTTGGGQIPLAPTNTQNFSAAVDNVPNGGTKTVTIPAIPFHGAMTCSVAVVLTYSFPVSGTYPLAVNYVVKTPPMLNIQESPVGTVSLIAALDPAYSTLFYLNGSSSVTNTSTTGSYTPAVYGTYTAKAYEAYKVNTVPSTVGCISSMSSNPIPISFTTAIIDGQNVNVSVYPNPMTSSLTISTGISYKLTYELSDMNGALLRNADFTSVATVNVENLKAGTYVLVVKDNDSKVAYYKLVK